MKEITIILLLLISSCTINKTTTETVPDPTTPKIIFLNIELSKDAEQVVKANLVDKIVVDGKLKTHSIEDVKDAVGDIKCTQVDHQSMPIESIYLNNPFSKTIEYVEEDGSFSKKQIELDSAKISIRMQIKPRCRFIIIENIDEPNLQLLKIEL